MKTINKLKFRSYSSVDEMVKLTLGSRWLKRMNQRLKHTEVVDQLVLARLRAGLSQTDLAARMKCTQSRVSKIEDSMDVQLSLKDIYEYTKAVGVECEFVLKGARALHARGHVGKVTR
jgi:ribosome-binding protein aMBF1 (putative translation factor)